MWSKVQDKICVIGLGKLGLVKAALHASKRKTTYGFDIDIELIKKIKKGISPYDEPNLEKLIKKSTNYLVVSEDLTFCLTRSSIVYIVVPTPSKSDGSFSNEFVLDVLEKISIFLSKSEKELWIVLCSTVMPSSCEKIFIPLMEKISNKVEGRDFHLIYSPEFIALGNIVNNMESPDLLLLGGNNFEKLDFPEKIARRILKNRPIIKKVNLVNAEISKLAVNTFITTKISFANFISEVSDKMPQANALVILNVLGSDSRIGSKYLKPGTSYGGPCFPRDNKAFSYLSNSLSIDSKLADATDAINKRQIHRTIELIESVAFSNSRVGILGLSYKENTPVIEESFGILVAKNLLNLNFQVYAFDPHINHLEFSKSNGIKFVDDPEKVIEFCDIILITLNYPAFKLINYRNFEGKIYLDYWNIFQGVNHGNSKLIKIGALNEKF